jgi:hypothetical protein
MLATTRPKLLPMRLALYWMATLSSGIWHTRCHDGVPDHHHAT